MAALVLLFGAAAISYIAVIYAKRWALAHDIMDVPNARSSHSQPMPRAGGIGIVLTFSAALITISVIEGGGAVPARALLGGGLAVAIVGLVDDLRHLPPWIRFSVHLLAASAVVLLGVRIDTISLPPFGSLSLGFLGAVLSVIWIVAVTNIYNFMDGIDGIAAGVAVLGGAGLAIIGAIRGELALVLLACALAGSALGFLAHNFPPASVFMGDVGSGFLGFVLAGLTLLAGSGSPTSFPDVAAGLVIAPFLLDGTLTLARRVARRERWYEAHRSHYYQRLVILGYSHRSVSLLYYGLTILAVLGAVAYVIFPELSGLLLMVAGIAPFFTLLIAVPRWESRSAGPRPSHS
ncbi:MAG TPA: glycosyltransferase family 4 protein [Chloroflexota bacterium]|nr:glycosyltransferase family 4 protein [Chloroflexota bacterium]